MLAGSPFPDGPSGGETSEVLLSGGRRTFQRFGDTGAYRDVPFAVIFLVQLISVVAIAIANGISVARGGTAGIDPEQHRMRSRVMLSVLMVSGVVASAIAALWLLLLRSGARVLIWAGATGGCAFALVNGVWLLTQGGAASSGAQAEAAPAAGRAEAAPEATPEGGAQGSGRGARTVAFSASSVDENCGSVPPSRRMKYCCSVSLPPLLDPETTATQ